MANNIQRLKTLDEKVEVINVRKDGVVHKVKIYPDKNVAKANEIEKILKKN